jgi:hypothetical protein
MNTNKHIEAAIAGASEQSRLVTGRDLAAWEVAAMRKQLTYQMENSNRRLERMKAASARLTAYKEPGEPTPVTSAAADFLRAFPTGRPRFRGTFGSHFTSINRRSF